VSGTHGKGLSTLGKDLQMTLGKQADSEATFAECFFSGTRQSFAVCQHALGKIKQNGLSTYGLR